MAMSYHIIPDITHIFVRMSETLPFVRRGFLIAVIGIVIKQIAGLIIFQCLFGHVDFHVVNSASQLDIRAVVGVPYIIDCSTVLERMALVTDIGYHSQT